MDEHTRGADPRPAEADLGVDEVEIEALAKRGEQVPRAKWYVIRIDKDTYRVGTATLTGAEILALAGLTPDSHKLYLHRRGQQPVRVEGDEVVDLTAPGVERFTTMRKDTTEGESSTVTSLRREFRLPAADEEYLEGLGLAWETVRDGAALWLLLHDWEVPSGYTVSHTSLGLLIPPDYSDTQIDMVYFRPALARSDGRPVRALAPQSICGQEWQRWSRHRIGENRWRPGVDDVSTHLSLVDYWLRREFGG